MATHPSPTRERGVGPLQYSILRAISDGWHDLASIRKHLSAKTGDQNLGEILMGMERRGLIIAGRGRRYYLANAGWAQLPRPDALVIATGHYVAPKPPPRRSGSDDWRRCPSVAAGVERPYQEHT